MIFLTTPQTLYQHKQNKQKEKSESTKKTQPPSIKQFEHQTLSLNSNQNTISLMNTKYNPIRINSSQFTFSLTQTQYITLNQQNIYCIQSILLHLLTYKNNISPINIKYIQSNQSFFFFHYIKTIYHP